jgi:DNA-binding NarL/FixJ family response regulator
VHAIVGRTEEISALAGFLADATSEPRALLIDGEPGIGKTTLLHELLTIARERRYAILSCHPTPSEMDLSYVGLVELLGGIGTDVINALPAPQARVLKMILRMEEPEGAFDRLSLGVATVAALRAVAATQRVLVAVDDAQWLDLPSAKTMAFVGRRLAGTAVRLAIVRSRGGFSASTGHDEPLDWHRELARGMPAGRLDSVTVLPLGPSEMSRILRRALGWVPAWPRVVRITELSAGNPLHALELARAFGGVRSADDLEGSLPTDVVALAQSRIAKLPDGVRDAVALASVPRAPTLELLRRLDPGALDLREAIAIAGRSGILMLEEERIRFSHPVLAAAAYGSIPVDRKRELHRAVAVLTDDLEERARHLATAATGPDPHVAVALEGAAEQAWRRGAPDAAADLLRMACSMTPSTDSEALAVRRVAFGRLLHSAGDAPGAIAELEALAAKLPHGLIRARALYHLMYVTRLSGMLGRAVEYGIQAAEESAADPSFQAEVYEMLSRLSDDDVARKLDLAQRGLASVSLISAVDPDVTFHVQAALVEAEFYAGLGIHLHRLDGLDPGPTRRFPPVRTAPRGDDLIGRLLTYSGRIDDGLAVLRGLYERAAVESRSILPAILGWMAEAQIMAGRFGAALELTGEAIARSEETGGTGGTPWEVGFHAVALAMLGRLDEADVFAARVLEMAATDPTVGLDEAPARLASGMTAMARGQFEGAVVHFGLVEAAKRGAGIRDPRVCAHASDLIEALVAASHLDEAAEVLGRFEDEAANSQGQWSLAAAHRCRALVCAAHGQLDDAVEAAQRSLSLFDGLPMPFEHARTVFVLGQIRRRRKEKRLAREALTTALDAFDELHASVWAERSRAELARIPQRLAPTGLTATERTIASLAADGLTNREIADRMFLSPKTVEVNLTRVYRKLGVRSRATLANRLASEGERGET